jgi:hypothetical protein
VCHRKPAARNDPTVSQRDDAALGLKPQREMLHYRRLADTRRADDVENTALFKSGAGLIDEFSAGKPYAADLILDLVQCVVRSFRQADFDGPQVHTLRKSKPVLLL